MSRKKRNQKNIQEPQNVDKVQAPVKELNYPVFCFKYLTTNKKYNIKFFGSNRARDKARAYGALFWRIEDLQSVDWKALSERDKFDGLEKIPIEQIKFSPRGLNLTPDTKVFSIRFLRGGYRILCVRSSINNDVLHVIGFDFNYSAYNHGS